MASFWCSDASSSKCPAMEIFPAQCLHTVDAWTEMLTSSCTSLKHLAVRFSLLIPYSALCKLVWIFWHLSFFVRNGSHQQMFLMSFSGVSHTFSSLNCGCLNEEFSMNKSTIVCVLLINIDCVHYCTVEGDLSTFKNTPKLTRSVLYNRILNCCECPGTDQEANLYWQWEKSG